MIATVKFTVTYEVPNVTKDELKKEYKQSYGYEPTEQDLNNYMKLQIGFMAKMISEKALGMDTGMKVVTVDRIE